MSVRDAAEQYRDRGWVPIPIEFEGKRPTQKAWQSANIESIRLEEFEGPTNIGIVLGAASGGLVDIDLDCPEAVDAAEGFLPQTGVIFGPESAPHSHWVYRVKDCGSTQKFAGDGVTLVEYRATGANTTFPPSTYEHGEPRAFSAFDEPGEVTRDELLRCVGKVAACALLAQMWTEGCRHDVTLALSGALARAGWASNDVENFVEILCAVAGDEEVESRIQDISTTFGRLERMQTLTGLPTLAGLLGVETARKLSKWLQLPDRNSNFNTSDFEDPTEALRCTDMGNADRFVSQHGNDVKYCKELGWLSWDGRKWRQGAEDLVQQKAEKTVCTIGSEMYGLRQHEQDQIRKWLKQSGSKERLTAMKSLVQSRVPVEVSKLDDNGWLFNCQNGTVDLKTGRLLPHNRDHLLTKIAPVTYDPSARCDRFEFFLREVIPNDDATIAFLQRWFGYCLTGETSEQCLVIFYGSGANGKSTLTNLFEHLYGDYACNTPVATLLAKKNDGGIPNDVARLRGARLVTASEAEDGQRLAVSLIKRLTGGDTITARFLHKEFFEFVPAGKIILPTNHKPKFDGSDRAMARRIHLVPFNVVFPKERQDGSLPQKLKAEAAGVLNWAIKGCLDWQREGLNPPNTVTMATSSYAEEMDEVGQFIKEAIDRTAKGSVTNDEMFSAYNKWAEDGGGEQVNKKVLTKRLKAAEMVQAKSGSNRIWKNCAIIGGGDPRPVEGNTLGVTFQNW